MNPDKSIIRSLSLADADWAASLHQRTQENTLLSEFGSSFLASLYEAFSKAPHVYAYVSCVGDDVPIGITVFTDGSGGILHCIGTPSALRLVPPVLSRLLMRPSLFIDILRTAHHALVTPTTHSAELLYLGVEKGHRRTGIASSLLAWGWVELSKHGITRIHVLVDERNIQALAFYKKKGFQTTDTLMLHRRQLRRLEKRL